MNPSRLGKVRSQNAAAGVRVGWTDGERGELSVSAFDPWLGLNGPHTIRFCPALGPSWLVLFYLLLYPFFH
jgi:hypothetical protein